MSHYLMTVADGCVCHYEWVRIPGEPHIPAYLEMEPEPDCPVHFDGAA